MYEVDGFLFESKEMADIAKREKNGVSYIKANTKMNDPDVVLLLYNRLNEQQSFSTPIGLSFMVELQEYLRSIPYIKNENILPINTAKFVADDSMGKKNKRQPESKYKKRFYTSFFCAVVFAVIIVGMFAITYISGHSVYVTDYENEIIDKYESWESELTEREKALQEREADTEWQK